MDGKSAPPPQYSTTMPYTDNPGQYPPQQYAPQQYAPQQQPNVVYVPGGQVMHRQPLANPPPDHLAYSIFVTICCCWPIGIFAILKAVETRDATNRGDLELATSKSREAKRFANWALGIGIAMVALSIIISIIYVVIIFTAVANAHTDDYN